MINRALRDHGDKTSDSGKLKQMSDNLRRAINNVFNTENEKMFIMKYGKRCCSFLF